MVKEKKWEKASFELSGLKDKFKDANIIYYYVMAEETKGELKLYKERAYQLAKDLYLDRIPGDYNGQFADKIKDLKKDVKETLEMYAKNRQSNTEYRKNHVYVGDSDIKVSQIFGEPLRKNRTVVGNTVSEQWVYSNKYIYITNGIVTGFQD